MCVASGSRNKSTIHASKHSFDGLFLAWHPLHVEGAHWLSVAVLERRIQVQGTPMSTCVFVPPRVEEHLQRTTHWAAKFHWAAVCVGTQNLLDMVGPNLTQEGFPQGGWSCGHLTTRGRQIALQRQSIRQLQ